MNIAINAKTSESGVQGIMRTLPKAVGRAALHELKANIVALTPNITSVVVQSTFAHLARMACVPRNHDLFYPR